MIDTPSSVIQTIQPLLNEFEWKGITLSVDEHSVHYDNGWWQISLQPSEWPQRLFPVIEEIGIIAELLEDEYHLKVMFSLGDPQGASKELTAA